MENDIKVKSKNKLNRKLLIGAAAVIAVALIVVLATVVSKSASAKRLEEQLSLGDKYLSELDYEQAIASYLAAIEIDPKNVDAYLGLADAYIALGEYDEAIEVLEDALEELSGSEKRAVKDKLKEIKELQELEEIEGLEGIGEDSEEISDRVDEEVIEENKYHEVAADIFSWIENEDGTVTISYIDGYDAQYIEIPEMIDGKKVVSLEGSYAFNSCYDVKKISIPDTVCSLNSESQQSDYRNFNGFSECAALEEVIVSESNPYFTTEDGVLYSKDMSTLIWVPNNYEGTFYVEKSVNCIAKGAFTKCADLTEIIFECENELDLSGEMFLDCVSLKSFQVTIQNESLFSVNGALFDDAMWNLIKVPPAWEGTIYTLPAETRWVDEHAFSGCINLEEIWISENLCAESQEYFFWDWDEEEEGVEILGSFFVSECPNLRYISVDSLNWDYVDVDGVLYTRDMNTLVAVPPAYEATEYFVPNGVENIGRNAFENCVALEYIELPESVLRIGPSAFSNCYALENITLPMELKYLCHGAFLDCARLSRIDFPGGINSISDVLFGGCASMTSFSVPWNVEAIESHAFSHCTNLEYIEIPASVKEISNDAFWLSDKVTIVTSSGSYAEEYAWENGIPVVTTLPTPTPTNTPKPTPTSTPVPTSTPTPTPTVVPYPKVSPVPTAAPIGFTLPEEESVEVFYLDVEQDSSAVEITIFSDSGNFDAYVSYSVQHVSATGEESSIGSVGIALYASDAINKNNTTSFLAEKAGQYAVYVRNAVSVNPYYYSGTNVNELQMTYRVIPPDENEPNGTEELATIIENDSFQFFNLLGEGDVDHFVLTLTENFNKLEVSIGCESGNFDSSLVYNVNKLDEETGKLTSVGAVWGAYASNAIRRNSTKKYKIDGPGIYYIKVTNASNANSLYYSGDNESYLYIKCRGLIEE